VLELIKALHDRVVQPLTAASLVLGLAELAAEDRIRAGAAVSAALAELDALVASATDEIEARPASDTRPRTADQRLETVVRSVVAEALLNVSKHAHPSEVTIVVHGGEDGVVTLDLLNDGLRAASNGRRGVGLRLAALEASSVGATLEAGPADGGGWRVRVCVAS